MTTAQKGDLVLVHYTGKFENGEVFDSSREDAPLPFVLGEGQIIPGFETAVEGMKIGEKKDLVITPEDAYGTYSNDKIIKTDIKNFGEDFSPEKDIQLALQMENGEQALATVKDFDKETVTLDLNHPLAGKTLNFAIELMEIKDASEMSSCGSSCSSCSGCGH